MKRFLLIRHGQSEDNAGITSSGLGLTPLTPLGQEQAAYTAEHLSEKPDLIVVSPFIRTSLTAEPLIARYPDVPVTEWPIEEFRQVGAARYHGLNLKDRSKFYQAHWERNDPHFVDGDGAESLTTFVNRVSNLRKLLRENEADLTVVYCHGFFLRTFAFLHFLGKESAITDNMAGFHKMIGPVHMHNCTITPGYVANQQIFLGNMTIEHIPPHKRS